MCDITTPGGFNPVIDTCDYGHKFAKLPDHPTKNGMARCPHCLSIGLDAERMRCVESLREWSKEFDLEDPATARWLRIASNKLEGNR